MVLVFGPRSIAPRMSDQRHSLRRNAVIKGKEHAMVWCLYGSLKLQSRHLQEDGPAPARLLHTHPAHGTKKFNDNVREEGISTRFTDTRSMDYLL